MTCTCVSVLVAAPGHSIDPHCEVHTREVYQHTEIDPVYIGKETAARIRARGREIHAAAPSVPHHDCYWMAVWEDELIYGNFHTRGDAPPKGILNEGD